MEIIFHKYDNEHQHIVRHYDQSSYQKINPTHQSLHYNQQLFHYKQGDNGLKQ